MNQTNKKSTALRKALLAMVALFFGALAHSPATAAVFEGQMVLTTEPARTFDEAVAKAVHEVKDGQPVYLHLRVPRPLSNYVYNWRDVHNSLQIEVGSEGNLREHYSGTPIELTDEEMKGSELHIPLAPAVPRGKSYQSVWTEVVGGGRPGTWHNEIRVLTYPDVNRLDVPFYLGVATLTADVGAGIDKYRSMQTAFLNQRVAGDPNTNQIPAKVGRADAGLAATIQKQAASALGAKLDAVYFTDDGWYDHKNAIGQVEYRRTFAAALYRQNDRCF
ncbi:MAG: hypothetical protein JO002_04415, partial [Burkholderiaceae bacterium]|nr:hypothetical protein [Burkholderiaceae bacterium]